MSTLAYKTTEDLAPDDLLLVNASMVSVDSVESCGYDDVVCILTVTCCSGNFDQWDEPIRVARGAVWTVLVPEEEVTA